MHCLSTFILELIMNKILKSQCSFLFSSMELCRVLVRLVRGSLLVPRARLFVVEAVETLCGNQKGTSFQEMVGARNLQSLMMTLLMLTLRRNEKILNIASDCQSDQTQRSKWKRKEDKEKRINALDHYTWNGLMEPPHILLFSISSRFLVSTCREWLLGISSEFTIINYIICFILYGTFEKQIVSQSLCS